MHAAYIHIPFCKSICTYCDFCKVFYNSNFVSKYLKALEEEIISQYNNEVLDSIYIGGGTPSSLTLDELNYLFIILKIFKRSRHCEITFECNIEDINEEKLYLLKENGVNRLSIGIESFNKKNLQIMRRQTDFKDTKEKIKLCRRLGFNNINVDLIYALPKESMFTLKLDIHKLLKLGIEHISTYSLILEKNTVLYNQKTKPIKEELDAKMYNYIVKTLTKNGYFHYELSNFAKEGYESVHNKTYWYNEEYYGFGCGASGYIGNIRYENTRSIISYINGKFTLNRNLLSRQEEMDNEIMLGLRLTNGLDTQKFWQKYQITVAEAYPNIKNLLQAGLLIKEGNYLKIPAKYLYIMNSIIIKII